MGGVLGKTFFAGPNCCVAWGVCVAIAAGFNQGLHSLVTVFVHHFGLFSSFGI